MSFSRPSRNAHAFRYGVILAAFVLGAATAARAAWNTLGETRELGAGITPGIAVDPRGAIHVVSMHDGAIVHWRAERNGAFGAAENIPVPEGRGNYNSPHLVSDAQGTLHLVFGRDVTGSAKKAWYATRRDGQWSAPLLVLDHSATGRRINYPRLGVTGDGRTVFVGGFAGGGSTVVRIDHADGAPKIGARVDTPLWVAHPLPMAAGELVVVGRAGASGHKLERYTRDLVRIGEPLLLSRGTPTKTFEATAAIVDARGVVHVAGATQTPNQVLWYTTSVRAAAGQSVVLGPELGHDIGERSYPVLTCDVRGRIYASYRDHASGESKLTVLEPDGERFAKPVVVAPAITNRLRWNAHLAAAPAGGVYTAWDADGKIFFRAVGEAAR